jgi:hypothetical protein
MQSDTQSRVISLRLRPELAREFKMEAARRGMKLNRLFEEIFRLYQKTRESGQNRREGKKHG